MDLWLPICNNLSQNRQSPTLGLTLFLSMIDEIESDLEAALSTKTHLTLIGWSIALQCLAWGQVGVEPTSLNQTTPDLPLEPSATNLLLDCHLSDYSVYIDTTNGSCFAYPNNYTIVDQNSGIPEIHGSQIGSELEPVFATLMEEIDPIQPGSSLRLQAETFFSKFSVVDRSTFAWEGVPISGKPGLMVEPIPMQLTWRIIFLPYGDKLFRLMYWPMDVPEVGADLLNLQQVSTQTFMLLDQEGH